MTSDNPTYLTADDHPYPEDEFLNAPRHRHGWECFRESGGYTNAMENDGTTIAEKIERVYRTAYRTGYRNGWRDRKDGRKHEFARDAAQS